MMPKIDTHVHSIASGHAFNTVDEIMECANIKNLELVCITDHGPSMKGAPHAEYFEMVVEVPLIFNKCFCLMGCECNVIDHYGHIDLEDKFLRNLDIVLVGLHKLTPYPEHSSEEENTSALINAMKNPYVDIIAHPYRKDFPVDIVTLVEAASKYNCMLELNGRIFSNTSNDRILIRTYEKMLKLCAEYRVYVVVGTDAHIKNKIGDFSLLNQLLKATNIHDGIIINDARKFIDILQEKREREKFKGVF
jgi:putative hydrolase